MSTDRMAVGQKNRARPCTYGKSSFLVHQYAQFNQGRLDMHRYEMSPQLFNTASDHPWCDRMVDP